MNKRLVCLPLFLLLVNGVIDAEILPDSLRISQSAAVQVADLLSGKESGVYVNNPGDNVFAASSVLIRGLNSLRTDNQPLWVVDGVELSADTGRNIEPFWQYDGAESINPLNPLSFLSPQDIERIEVLKDATATSAYGSRGANGVVIITTRKQASSRKFEAELASNVGVICNTLDKHPSVAHNHHLSISGTAKGTSYYVTGNYRDDKGLISGSRGQFVSALAGLNTSAGEFIKFGMNTILSGGDISSPIYCLADYDDSAREYRGILSSYLHFNLKKFSIKLEGGADYFRSDRGIWYGKGTEFGACTILYPDGGAGSMLTTNTLSYNLALSGEYNTYFADNHKLNAFLTAKVYGDANTLNTQNGRNFINHSLKAKGLNYKSTLPLNRNFDYSIFHPEVVGGLSYNWNDALGVSAAVEIDGNTRFLLKNTFKINPSVTAFLDFARLFSINPKVASEIRIEGGWGKSGKDVYAPYEWFGKYIPSEYPVPAPGTEMFYDGLDVLSTTEWHIGGTLGFVHNRFAISVNYYDRNTDDKFAVYNRGGDPVEIKGTIYLKYVDPAEVYSRTDKVVNRGYECDLKVGIIKTNHIEWNLSMVGAYNQNNFPVGRILGYELNADGKPVDQTGEGRITEEDIVELGRSIPIFTGGFNTEFRWKNLSVITSGMGTRGMIADYFRLDNLGVNYHFPINVKWMQSVDLRLVGRNLAFAQPETGPYKFMRSVVFGVTVKF